jgi:serine/threonine protein kinase
VDWWALGEPASDLPACELVDFSMFNRNSTFIRLSEEPYSQMLGNQFVSFYLDAGILLYEMLFGRTPFRGKNRQKTFSNVLEKEIYFPSSIPVSLEAKLLIRDLLNRDPITRLGSYRGADDIKNHPFFRDIKWPLIRNMVCPNAP